VIALLDVNVLLPLFDEEHPNHDAAHAYFESQRADGWATCPFTENGLIRLLTRPGFMNPPLRAIDMVAQLRSLRRTGSHHFWPATLSLTDETVFDAAFIAGHKQLTDVYLLGLAKVSGGTFATFDRSIQLRAVKGATAANLQIISAA